MTKIVCPEPPLILMNPMHHPVTMAKNYVFLPIGVEGQAKQLFLLQHHLWYAPLWTNVRTGDQSTGPHVGHQGLAAARALQVDENTQCIGSLLILKKNQVLKQINEHCSVPFHRIAVRSEYAAHIVKL